MEMEMNDANGNSISNFLYIQKFYEEYEQLQLEHSRLRQQLNDQIFLQKELKESVEFITAENNVLTESLKDLEDTRFKERVEWLKEKENHEEALVYYRNLCENSSKHKQEIAELKAKLAELEESNEKLKQKYVRNRKVWEDNEKNLTNEIERIDSFIAVLVDTLKKLPDTLKNCTELKEIITLIEQNEADKSIKM